MKQVLLMIIRLYQLSRPFRPASCRFYPSCSSYACECICKHGVLKGLILTCWRLLRCQPLSAGGLDEVPDEFPAGFIVFSKYGAASGKRV